MLVGDPEFDSPVLREFGYDYTTGHFGGEVAFDPDQPSHTLVAQGAEAHDQQRQPLAFPAQDDAARPAAAA